MRLDDAWIAVGPNDIMHPEEGRVHRRYGRTLRVAHPLDDNQQHRPRGERGEQREEGRALCAVEVLQREGREQEVGRWSAWSEHCACELLDTLISDSDVLPGVLQRQQRLVAVGGD